jgi:hypothetical protein
VFLRNDTLSFRSAGRFSKLRLLALLVLSLWFGSGLAWAGTYKDPSGFSFTYPDDWIPVAPAATQDQRNLPVEAREWLAKNKVDFKNIKVVLVHKGPEGGNLNVGVEKQQISTDNQAVKRLTEVASKQYKTMGIPVSNLQSRIQKFGSRDAVVLEYQARFPGNPSPVWQRQVFFPGGGNTYIVTCTASPEMAKDYGPVFDRILATFECPAPAPTGFNWRRIVNGALVGGIAGVLVAAVTGGLVYLFRRLSKKAKPRVAEGHPPTEIGPS